MPKTIRNVYDKAVSFEKILVAYKKARRGKREKYFQNIDKRILWDILKRKIKDRKLLWLTRKILLSTEKMKGLLLGNYTSQMFANIYLNELDQYAKHMLKCEFYFR